MRKKINLALITIGVVIAGVVLVTGIARFNNRNKTEVKDNQTSTSISEQVEQTPESGATSDIEIIEDETNISDDGLTSSNAGGSSEPVEVEITEDGVVTDKPEPYPDEWSLITQPEDNENNSEDNAESGVIKGPDLSNDETSSSVETPKKSVSIDISSEEIDSSLDGVDTSKPDPMTEEEKQDFINKVKSYGTTLH